MPIPPAEYLNKEACIIMPPQAMPIGGYYCHYVLLSWCLSRDLVPTRTRPQGGWVHYIYMLRRRHHELDLESPSGEPKQGFW